MPECVDGLVCGTGLWTVPVPVNPELNGSALTATPGFGGIHLSWTLNDSSLHGISHTKIYRGLSGDFGLALEHVVVKGTYYFDAISDAGTDTTYFYWIKNVDTQGVEGNLIGPVSCQVIPPVEQLLIELTGRIDDTYLANALKTDIGRITGLETSISEEVINRTGANTLINTLLAELQNTTNNINTLLVDEINTRVTDNGVYISSLNALGGMVGDNAALIATETQLRVDADTAFASELSVLTGRVGTAESTLASLELVSVSEVEALTDRITTAESTLGTTVSRLTTEETTRASADSALSGRVTNLEVGLDGQITTAVNQAIVASVGYCEIGGVPNASKTTKSACESAGGVWLPTGQLAAEQNTYEVSNNGRVGNVETTVGSHTTSIGQIMTQYVVKLGNTAANGKQLIGGFGLTNTGVTVDAGFDVDTFWIGRTNANAIKPFIVDSGVVYIDTAVIKDATISTAKIGNLAVTSAKIASGNITGTHIAGSAITGSHIAGSAITGSHIAGSIITGSHIAGGTIDGANIKNATIGEGNIIVGAINGVYFVQSTIATNVEVTSLTNTDHLLINYGWFVPNTPSSHDYTLWYRQVYSNGTRGSWVLMGAGLVNSYSFQSRTFLYVNSANWFGIELYAASRTHQASQAISNPLIPADASAVTQLLVHKVKR